MDAGSQSSSAAHTDLYRSLSMGATIGDLITSALRYSRAMTGSTAYIYVTRQGLPTGAIRVIAAGSVDQPGYATRYDTKTGRPLTAHLPIVESAHVSQLKLGPQACSSILSLAPGVDYLARYLEGHGSVIEVPIFDRGEVFGHLLFLRAEPQPATQRQIEFAVHATDVYLRSIVEHRLRHELLLTSNQLDDELGSVAAIQQQLIPPLPPDSRASSFAARYVPCTRAGGDFFSVRRNTAHSFTMVIADVAGHGAGAAVVVAMLRAWLGIFRLGWRPIESAAADINQLWSEIGTLSTFATAIFLDVDERTGTTRCINCGHPPALVIAADGAVRELNHDSTLPLGVLPEITTPLVTDRLSPGDSLLLYTDGIIEAANPRGERLGTKRLYELLTGAITAPTVKSAADVIIEQVVRFQDGPAPADDQCVVIARLAQLIPVMTDSTLK